MKGEIIFILTGQVNMYNFKIQHKKAILFLQILVK